MAKDAYWFSHDANARNDIKIKALRKKYGSTGYGNYWILIEYMRENETYALPLKPYTYEALADEFNMSSTDVQQFINDCIETFELFKKNEDYFYSDSLLKRMEKLDNKREQARRAGIISGKKRKKVTDVEQTLNDRSTIKENKSKVNKSKVNEIKKDMSLFEKTLDEFYKMRKSIKKPMTARAKEMLLTKLTDIAKEDEQLKIKILEQSIFHNWQGVFPLKQNQDKCNNNKSAMESHYDKVTKSLKEKGWYDE